MKNRILFSAVIVAAMVPGGHARAQGSGAGSEPVIYSTNVGYLGIENLRCNCTVSRSPGDVPTRYVFRSEPMILGIAAGSPGAGILARGDTIVQVNGYSILTTEGSRKFSGIKVGDEVNFVVRRRGNLVPLTVRAGADPGHRVYTRMITPEAESGEYGYDYAVVAPRPARAPATAMGGTPPRPAEAPRLRVWTSGGEAVIVTPARPAEPAVPGFGSTPSAPRAAVAPALPSTPATRARAAAGGWGYAVTVPSGAPSPKAWFGFSIRCSDCGWSSSGRPGESPVWESEEAPELSMIASNSPASRASLRQGDRITHIDGISILSTNGRRKFGSVMPGQRIRLTIDRDGKTLMRDLTLGTRPEVRAAIAARTPRAPTPPSMRRELRYSGKLDDVTVEVFSPGGPTVERIGDTMIITVGSSVVRLKVDSKNQ